MNKLNLLMILTLTSCGNMSGGSTPTNNRNSDTTPKEDKANRDRSSNENINKPEPAKPVNNGDVPPVPPAPPAPPLPNTNSNGKKRFLPNVFGNKNKKNENESNLINHVDELKNALSRKARPGSAIFKAKQLSEDQKLLLQKERENLKEQLKGEKEKGIGKLKAAKRLFLGNSVIKKLEKTENQLREDAAITIQSAWKGYSERNNLLKSFDVNNHLEKAKNVLRASQIRKNAKKRESEYMNLEKMLVFKNILGPVEPISYDNTNKNGEQQQEPIYALAEGDAIETKDSTNSEADYF